MTDFIGIEAADCAIFMVAVIIPALAVHRLLRFSLLRYINKSSREIRVDPTRFVFLKNGLSLLAVLGTAAIILYSIPELRALGLSLFAGAGIPAAFIGFASQAAFSRLISGIYVAIFKPFRMGGVIKVRLERMGIELKYPYPVKT